MLGLLKIQKPMLRLSSDFIAFHKRLIHLTSTIQANTLEEVKRRERDVEPLPPLPQLKMEPFVKNLCVGKVDSKVLAYPEFDLGRLNIVEEMASELQKHINGLDSLKTAEGLKISDELLSKLKETGIFGVNIPEEYKGAELTCMEISRLCEVLASDPSLFQALNVHISFISQIFCMYASEQQKKHYLPLLASGELLCGLALWEENAGLDLKNMSCQAVLVDNEYKISGSKMWASNIGLAHKFLVFATVLDKLDDTNTSNVTCFLVDKHSPGVTAKRMDTVGLHGFDQWELTFNRTPVPVEHVIGGIGEGLEMIFKVYYGNFTVVGAAYASVLRRLLDYAINHVTHKNIFNMPLSEFQVTQSKLCELACLIYTLESISYLTANFVDDYEDPDCSVEATIVKLFGCQALSRGFEICSSLLGSQVYLKDNLWNSLLHDLQFSTTVEHNCDHLRSLISSMCIEHVCKYTANEIKQKRDPFHHPQVAWKNFLGFMDQKDEVPMIEKIVPYHLHPLLEESSSELEQSISYLKFTMHKALLQWGTEIFDKHADLARFADMAMDCFCITAVLARASRSFCIGLRNTDEELLLAKRITLYGKERVVANSKLILNSPFINQDNCFPRVTDMLINSKSYGIAHPLARNY